MASFASQPAQFSPYVAPTDLGAQAQRDQQDLQAQIQIGTFKQQQYEVNAQKIQGMVDQVAGLQVSRDVDKEYLNQQIGEMETNINKMMKADYSKQQLFRQAGSFAAKAYNDPKILSAVMSTQHAQDLVSQQQKATEEGKSSMTNDWQVEKKIAQWRANPEVGATFSKQSYIPYNNYQKPLQDFMQGKHGDVIVKQDPFGGSADGTGGWNAYALREGKLERLTSAEVQEDIKTFFATNAQAAQQLDIDAEYYADKTDTNLAFKDFQTQSASYIKQMETEIDRLQSDSKINVGNSVNNQAQIELHKEAILKAQAMRPQQESAFLEDPSGIKKQVYKNQVIQGFGNRYAYTNLEQKIVKNPIFEAQMDVADMGLKERKFAWEQKTDQRDYDQAERKMANDIRAAQIASGIIVGGQYDAKTAEAYTPQQYEQDLKGTAVQVAQDQMQTLYNTGAYNELVEPTQNSAGETVYHLKKGVTRDQFTNAWQTAQSSYYSNPQGANRALKNYFEDATSDSHGVGLERAYFAESKRYSEVKTELDEKFKGDAGYKKYQESLNSLGSQNDVIATEGGVDLTRADIIAFTNAGMGGKTAAEATIATGLPTAKVALLQKMVESEIEGNSFLSALQAPGAVMARFFGGSSPAAMVRKEVAKVNQLTQGEDNKRYKEEQTKAFRNIMSNKGVLSVGEKVTDKNANKLAAMTTFARNQPDKAEEIAAVTGQKGAGDITIGAFKNPVTGQVTGFVTNSKGVSATIDLDPITASQIQPTLVQNDPYAAVDRILDAQQGKFRGINSSTPDNQPYLPRVSNLANYNVKFGITRTGDKSGYAPVIKYQKKGQDYWTPLPYEFGYVGSAQEAFSLVDQSVSKGDEFFENTFLK